MTDAVAERFIWRTRYSLGPHYAEICASLTAPHITDAHNIYVAMDTVYLSDGCKIHIPLFKQFNSNLPWITNYYDQTKMLLPTFKKSIT